MTTIEKELKHYDRSLLNSALSYAIYTKNSSWFESWAKLKSLNSSASIPMKSLMQNDSLFNPTKIYDRMFSALINDKLQPAELNLKKSDNHMSPHYLYEHDSKYENGIYKCMDNFGAATAMKSKNEDGTYTLHIGFRGTDTQAKPFLKYLAKAYTDMGAYYDAFKPFETSVLEFAKDPNNKISKIEVSGHSLGGSMVQQFFHSQQVKNSSLLMEGFTYGSPPAIAKNLYKMIPAAFHVLKHFNFKHMLETTKEILFNSAHEKENRITQYEHMGDLIPRLGKNFMMYKTGEKIISLKDFASAQIESDYMLTNGKKTEKDIMSLGSTKKTSAFLNMADCASDNFFKKSITFLVRASKVVYHDMARYSINTDTKIKEIKQNNQNFNDSLTPNHNYLKTLQQVYQFRNQALRASHGISPKWQDAKERLDSSRYSMKNVGLNINSMRDKVNNSENLPLYYKKI